MSILRTSSEPSTSIMKSKTTVLNFQPSLDGKPGPCDDYDYNFRTNKFWFNLLAPMIRTIVRIGWRIKVEGVENIPREKPFVVMPSHSSHLDSFVCGPWFPRAPIIIADEKLYQNKYFVMIAKMFNTFPVRKGTHSTAIVEYAINRVNRKGDVMMWYPEGQRNKNPLSKKLMPGKLGSGMFAHAIKADIIPAFISGTESAMPIGSRLTLGRGPRSIKIQIKYGKPVKLDDLRDLPPSKEVSQQVVDRIMHAMEELRPKEPYQIQKVCNKDKKFHIDRLMGRLRRRRD